MGGDIQQQHDLTKALESATLFRQDADSRWRDAIAAAHAAGVPRRTIIEAAGIADALLVQDILRQLEQRGGALETN